MTSYLLLIDLIIKNIQTYRYIRDFNLMVKYVTFNHHYMGSNPISLK